MENKNCFFIDAAAAYQISLKGLADRREKRKKEVWEAIQREAAAGNFCLLENWLSDELIDELRDKGFEVTYSKGMFMQDGCYKIDWSKNNEEE